MIKFFLTSAVALLSVAASPVLARDAQAGSSSAEPQASERPSVEASAVKYCVIEEFTGSRIAHKTCQTRADWLKQGFDPLAKN